MPAIVAISKTCPFVARLEKKLPFIEFFQSVYPSVKIRYLDKLKETREVENLSPKVSLPKRFRS